MENTQVSRARTHLRPRAYAPPRVRPRVRPSGIIRQVLDEKGRPVWPVKEPVVATAAVACEVCGVIEFLTEPEPFDNAEFAALLETTGWSLERGPVTCPDCLAAALRGADPPVESAFIDLEEDVLLHG